MNHLEIEFKTGLTENEFQKLLPLFKEVVPVRQINYYIDTADFALKKRHMALRIRKFVDRAELTLKIPQDVGTFEYNQELSLVESQQMLEQFQLPEGEVLDQLKQSLISTEELAVLGSLTTIRREMKHSIGLLALDQSFYFDQSDIELEVEVQDSQTGKEAFQNFLRENDIAYKRLKSKIARFRKNLPNS